MANLNIYIKHVPTGQTVSFIAFMETFTDTYSAEWSSEKVFGRMDPIAQYKGTGRVVSLNFTVPAASEDEAILNHRKISKLINFMYPTYEANPNIRTYVMTAPPLMRVKFSALIKNQTSTATDANGGLLCFIPDIKYEPNMDSNIFSVDDKLSTERGIEGRKRGILAFQSLKVGLTMNILHDHRLGWGLSTAAAGGGVSVSPSTPTFPLGFDVLKGT